MCTNTNQKSFLTVKIIKLRFTTKKLIYLCIKSSKIVDTLRNTLHKTKSGTYYMYL